MIPAIVPNADNTYTIPREPKRHSNGTRCRQRSQLGTMLEQKRYAVKKTVTCELVDDMPLKKKKKKMRGRIIDKDCVTGPNAMQNAGNSTCLRITWSRATSWCRSRDRND